MMYTRHIRVPVKALQEGLKKGQSACEIAIKHELEEIDDEYALEHICAYSVSIPFTATGYDDSGDWSMGEDLEKTIVDLKSLEINRNAENEIPEEYREDLDDVFGEGWQFDAIEEYVQNIIDICSTAVQNGEAIITFMA